MEILFRCNRYLYYIQDEYIKRINYIRGEYESIKHLDDLEIIAHYKRYNIPIYMITKNDMLYKVEDLYNIIERNSQIHHNQIDYTEVNIKKLKDGNII